MYTRKPDEVKAVFGGNGTHYVVLHRWWDYSPDVDPDVHTVLHCIEGEDVYMLDDSLKGMREQLNKVGWRKLPESIRAEVAKWIKD